VLFPRVVSHSSDGVQIRRWTARLLSFTLDDCTSRLGSNTSNAHEQYMCMAISTSELSDSGLVQFMKNILVLTTIYFRLYLTNFIQS